MSDLAFVLAVDVVTVVCCGVALHRMGRLGHSHPATIYLFFHLVINATIVAGPSNYQAAVDQIHLLKRLGLLLPVEMAFIFIPLAFHAILGLLILFGATPNASQVA